MNSTSDAATILLVEDDEVLRKVFQRTLTREGYRVLSAADVPEALRLVQGQTPRLALLDLCLGDGDGLELARELRARYADVPLIMVTGYPVRLQERPELARQFECVLTKPVDLEELRRVVNKASGGGNVRAGVPARPGHAGGPKVPMPSPQEPAYGAAGAE